MSINSVSITGNLGADSALRYTASQDPILSFSVAVNDRVRNPRTGEWSDRPNWVKCTIFGKRAESLVNYLKKGSKVAIEGKLRQNTWERDGVNHSEISVIVGEVEFFSGSGQVKQAASQATMATDLYYDDIPL